VAGSHILREQVSVSDPDVSSNFSSGEHLEARLTTRLEALAVGGGTRRSKDVAWAMSSRVGGQLMSFVTTPILARLIDPAAFGVVAVASVFTGFIALFADLGLGGVLVRRKDLRGDLVTTVFYINLVFGILAAALIAGLSFPLAAVYRMPQLREVLSIAGLQILVSVTVVPTALLERAFRFRRLAAIEFAAALVGSVATVAMAVEGWGAVSLVAGPLAALIFQDCMLWSVVRVAPRGRPTRHAGREIWSFSGPLMIFNSLLYWARNIDNLVLGLVAGAVAVGIYARAYILMLVPVTQVTVVMGRVLLPALSRYYDDIPRMRATYVRALRLSSSLTIPVGAGLACLASPIVAVLFGARWHGMVILLTVLAATVPVQVVVAGAGPIYQALAKTRMWSRRAAVTAVLTMIALCGGAIFGATGVAVGFAIAWCGLAHYAVSQPWALVGLSIREGIASVLSALVSALAMAGWLVGFGHIASAWGAGAWLAAGAVSGAVVYLAVMALVGRAVLMEWVAELRRLRS
jgi:PST family polysaccharide transporter